MPNVAALLADAATRAPAAPGLADDHGEHDHASLAALAARFAGLFASRGVTAGDRVGLWLQNGAPLVAAYHGVLALGGVVVPLNAALRGGEVDERVEQAGIRVLVAPPARAGELTAPSRSLLAPLDVDGSEPRAGVLDRDGGDLAELLFTSGTTGRARAAELTHGGLTANARAIAGAVLGLSADDVVACAVPLAHVFGQSAGMNASLVAGARLLLADRFRPEQALQRMAAARATVFLGVPTMCVRLLDAAGGEDAPPLRLAHVGGAPASGDVLQRFEARFGCAVLEGYGMTEASGLICAARPGESAVGSVGTPVPDTTLRIVADDGSDAHAGETGEVLVRGPGVMRGYHGDRRATQDALTADGWLRTGDVGFVDEAGRLHLTDRKKDLILRGGYSVSPSEVEAVLCAHPDVADAVVVGVPDAALGEEVGALVVPRRGDCSPDELREFVRGRLAGYKYPRIVLLADDLPRSPTGKVLRRAIDRDALRRALDQS